VDNDLAKKLTLEKQAAMGRDTAAREGRCTSNSLMGEAGRTRPYELARQAKEKKGEKKE